MRRLGLAAAARRVGERYRASGADLPWGNQLAAHGLAMEGYFWRLTDRAAGTSVIALIGINRDRAGSTWATVGLADWPAGFLRTAALPHGWADPHRLGARSGTEFLAEPDRIAVDLGPQARLEVEIEAPRPWPDRAFGGSSYFQTVPGLNQYWHPWLLGGRAHGTAQLDGRTLHLRGAEIYAEKNWGKGGFPDAWWWGQGQGFDSDACVAFAGGEITAGPLRTTVTGLVVRLPRECSGQVVRLGNPLTSPVRARITDDSWSLHGRTLRPAGGWDIRVLGSAPRGAAHVLPVPLPDQRRNVAGALEHLGGRLEVEVRRHGRLIWRDTSPVAGLEHGGARTRLAPPGHLPGGRVPPARSEGDHARTRGRIGIAGAGTR